MNRALWNKAWSAAWPQLVGSSVLLVFFGWLFVWLMGLFQLGIWSKVLSMLPSFSQRMLGVPIADLATPVGQLSFLYDHVITMLISLSWAIGRGSDPVSGEISRGTMDLTLTLPVRRVTVLAIPAIVATLGAVVLAAAVLGGNWIGLVVARPEENIPLAPFVPGAINLAAMTFALTGITSVISSFNRDRWRTISIAVVFFVVSLMVKMIARIWEPGEWLRYASFLTPFDPQRLVLAHGDALRLSLWYDGTLVAVGLAGYVAGAAIFSRRDIPAAL
ncbi:MAG: ABC transporter permease subunit [Planctomycetia bacterium]|nr:ABC transporter permease subunit [Planctomycetia bacterium]